jgi:hypothetical protein
MLKRAQQAMGGTEKLAGIKDLTASLEMAMDPSGGGMKIKQQVRWVAPNTIRQDQSFGVMTIVAFTDGKSGWISQPQGVMSMTPEVLRQAQGEAFREIQTLMMSDRNASRTVSAVTPNAVDISGESGLSVRVEFDDATGLPLRETYQETGIDGKPSEVKETYSDWLEVDGIKLPFKAVMEQNGKKSGEASISEIKLNTGISAEELSKKPEAKK